MDHWKKLPSNQQLLPLVDNWYQGEIGQRVLQAEQALIKDFLSNAFGYQLLQLSATSKANLIYESRIQSNVICHPLSSVPNQDHTIESPARTVCLFDELPFAEDSFDAVVLHHAQEFVANPHNVLREVERIVIPNGKIMIIGFNPWSLLGLYSSIAGISKKSMWRNHLLSKQRMVDWLILLGFKVTSSWVTHHRPPIKVARIFDNMTINKHPLWRSIPFGGVYCISAVKRVSAVTPQKPSWSKKRAFAGLAPIKPTTRVLRKNHKD